MELKEKYPVSNEKRFVKPLFVCLILCLIFLKNTYAQESKSGPLIIIGGALDRSNFDIYNEIVKESGGSSAKIGIITAASNEKYHETQVELIEDFRSRGVEAHWIDVHRNNKSAAYSQENVALAKKMTAYYIGGGSQLTLKELLMTPNGEDTPVLAAIRRKHLAGAPIAGTSAGAAIMSGSGQVMITGGHKHEGLLEEATPFDRTQRSEVISYDPKGGFHLFSHGIIDTHFSERLREGRLIKLASDTGMRLGFGVDENTAMILKKTISGRAYISVKGTGGVYIVDLSVAEVKYVAGYWTIHNVINHYIKKGDIFFLDTARPQLGSISVVATHRNKKSIETLSFKKGNYFNTYEVYREVNLINSQQYLDAKIDAKVSVKPKASYFCKKLFSR